MIENEFKVMLTEHQYNIINRSFGWDKTVEQTNYYYDTEDLILSGLHITCRVREIGGNCFLQMKLCGGADYSRIELEEPLGHEIPDTLGGKTLSRLCKRDLPDVKLLGILSTSRQVKKTEGAEIDLDTSRYFGIVDHELEIEFTDENRARTLMNEISQIAGIPPHPDICEGKIRRFLAEYLRIRRVLPKEN